MSLFSKKNESEKKKSEEAVIIHTRKKWTVQHYFGIFVLLILMIASVWSIMSRTDIKEVPHLVPEQTASSTIYAAIPFTYIDQEETKYLHRETLSKQPLFFRVQRDKINILKSELGKFRKKLEEKGSKFSDGALFDNFSNQITIAAQSGLISSEDQQAYRKNTYRLLDYQGRCPVEKKAVIDAPSPQDKAREISKNIIYDFFREESPGIKLKEEEFFRKHAERILNLAVMDYDEAYTTKAHEQALKEVGVVQYEYERGSLILRKGAIVKLQDIKKLKLYKSEMEKHKLPMMMKEFWIRLFKSCCITILMIVFTVIYVTHIHPEVVQSGSRMSALGLIVLMALLLNIFFVKLFVFSSELFSIPPQLWYLAIPIGFAPIVIALLIGIRVALFSGLFISLVVSFSGVNQFNMVVFGMVVSALASYSIKSCWNYRSLFLRGFFVLTIVPMILAVIFCWRDNQLMEMLPWTLTIPIVTSIATIVLVQFCLFILETIFDLASKISLNLFCDYNHPLLKEMQIKSPGTYHHSLVVSMLAESAAEEIGANSVKARVGALFHDIGKIARPEYFTENNTGTNLHESLTPKESAAVIINHVHEGMKLAKEYKLKRPIRNAIEQHHGTDLVYYFYKQAKDRGECFNEQDFRYSGPKPQSKEIAIISLADACEAASRSLDRPTPEQIYEMVNTIIQKRLKEGQLDDCALTFRELSRVRNSFAKTLTSMLHARIAYPKDEEDENGSDLFVDAESKASAEKKS